MVRALAECLLVVALLVLAQGRARADADVYVVVRDPVAVPSVPTSLLQSGRAELEALVRARPRTVLGSGALVGAPPPPFAALRGYVVQARILTLSTSATSARIQIAIEVTDLATGRAVVSSTSSVSAPPGMATSELFERALRTLWAPIAEQLRP